MDVAMRCRLFLDKEVPANVTKLPIHHEEVYQWRVSATLFVDYVPLCVEVGTGATPDGVSFVALTHISRSDVVRFNRVCERLAVFLGSSGLPAAAPPHAIDGGEPLVKKAGLIDDDFMDEISTDDEEASWADRVELMLADLESGQAHVREEAVQGLARWAASAAESHSALARGFASHAETVGKALFGSPQASVAETYPLAAALRSVAFSECVKAKAILSESPLAAVMDEYEPLLAAFPPLVARELSSLMLGMQKVSVKASVKKPFEYDVVCESPSSTCCSGLDSIRYFEDESFAAVPMMDTSVRTTRKTLEASTVLKNSKFCFPSVR